MFPFLELSLLKNLDFRGYLDGVCAAARWIGTV
jgi:hypothetical protein